MSSHLDAHKNEFLKTIEHFQHELTALRTGRAHVGLVDTVRVDAYGQMSDLKSVASLTTPDAKTLQIEPWDKTLVKAIEKALIDASLGMQPNTAGTVIRLVVPATTEEGRKNLVKILRQKSEDARIGIRSVREKVKTLIVEEEKAKMMSEDERRRALEALDKATGEYNTKIESLAQEKETEILTI